MTLISAFVREDGVILLGDALLTSCVSDFRDHELPTIGLPNEHDKLKDAPFHIAGMCRKIVPVTDNTCLLVSGPISEIGESIKSLVVLCKQGFYSDKALRNLIIDSGLDKIKFRGMLLSCDDKGYAFENIGMHMQEHRRRRYIYTAGSGRESFNSNFLKAYRKQKHDPLKAIAGTLAMCSTMLLAQYRNGDGLLERYGGFFECVTNRENGFAPINNILYIVRNFWFDSNAIYNSIAKEIYETNNILHNVDLMMYVTYVGDNIVVTRWLSDVHPRFCCVPSLTQHRFIPLPEQFSQIDWVVESHIYAGGGPMIHSIKSGNLAREHYSVSVSDQDCSAYIPTHLFPDAVERIKVIQDKIA